MVTSLSILLFLGKTAFVTLMQYYTFGNAYYNANTAGTYIIKLKIDKLMYPLLKRNAFVTLMHNITHNITQK